MNISKHDKNCFIDWQKLCVGYNKMNGTRYKTQRGLLNYLYNKRFHKSPTKLARLFGVSIQAMRAKLISEGIHKNRLYEKSRIPIGKLRKQLREILKEKIRIMTFQDLKTMFSEYNIRNITRFLRQDNIQYSKKYYWVKCDKLKRR